MEIFSDSKLVRSTFEPGKVFNRWLNNKKTRQKFDGHLNYSQDSY